MARQARTDRHEDTPLDIALRRTAERAALAGLEHKAEDVKLLDVRGLSSYADYIVIMTAASERQVGAIASAVDGELSKAGVQLLGVEGLSTGNWALIDTGDVVIHVFHRDARGFYDLDGLWSDAKQLTVEEPQSTVPPVVA